jgi:hypothetical protein
MIKDAAWIIVIACASLGIVQVAMHLWDFVPR